MRYLVFVLIFTIGCDYSPEQYDGRYGEPLNEWRKSVGLRIVDTSMTTNYSISRFERRKPIVWYNGSDIMKNGSEPRFFSKTLYFDENTGEKIIEVDKYFGGFNIAGVDGYGGCQLLVRIAYQLKTIDTLAYPNFRKIPRYDADGINFYANDCLIDSTIHSNVDRKFYKAIQLESKEGIVDSVLTSWNLSRYNY